MPRIVRPARSLLHASALALVSLALAGGGAACAEEPEPPPSGNPIVEYHESGAWARDTAAVIERARNFVRERAGAVRRPAIVLDIDDTSLSSYECLKPRDFERSPDSPCARSADLPAIPETLELFDEARSQGVAVFFITGRRERLREATVANLRAAGYSGWRGLVMRPNRERPGRHDGFKARERRRIEARGFRILANVGDQHSDLDGGAALRRFKLPNPMYVIADA